MTDHNKFFVAPSYGITTSTEVTLPEGKTYSDIVSHYIKWDTFYWTFDKFPEKGEPDNREWYSADLTDRYAEPDMKRPDYVKIYSVDADYPDCWGDEIYSD